MVYEFTVTLEVDGEPQQVVSRVSDAPNESFTKVFGELEREHPGAKLLSLTYHQPPADPDA